MFLLTMQAASWTFPSLGRTNGVICRHKKICTGIGTTSSLLGSSSDKSFPFIFLKRRSSYNIYFHFSNLLSYSIARCYKHMSPSEVGQREKFERFFKVDNTIRYSTLMETKLRNSKDADDCATK